MLATLEDTHTQRLQAGVLHSSMITRERDVMYSNAVLLKGEPRQLHQTSKAKAALHPNTLGNMNFQTLPVEHTATPNFRSCTEMP